MKEITEINYEIKIDDMPRDVRTIYTFLKVPDAHKKLEELHSPARITIGSFRRLKFL